MIRASIIKSIVKKLLHKSVDRSKMQWKDFEYFDNSWKNRIAEMAVYIVEGETIVDFGCGKEWLREFIAPGINYIPVDYIKRSEDTILCDFNNYEFPHLNGTNLVAFVSGCLEYIEDPKWFLLNISKAFDKAIISYCHVDFIPDISIRNKLGWKNHYSIEDLKEVFKALNYRIITEKVTVGHNYIYFLNK